MKRGFVRNACRSNKESGWLTWPAVSMMSHSKTVPLCLMSFVKVLSIVG